MRQEFHDEANAKGSASSPASTKLAKVVTSLRDQSLWRTREKKGSVETLRLLESSKKDDHSNSTRELVPHLRSHDMVVYRLILFKGFLSPATMFVDLSILSSSPY